MTTWPLEVAPYDHGSAGKGVRVEILPAGPLAYLSDAGEVEWARGFCQRAEARTFAQAILAELDAADARDGGGLDG